jgi:periplasmic copper chaperone A
VTRTGNLISHLVLLAICAVGLFGAALAAQDAAVVARDAWVRVPAPSKTETALYVVLENLSARRRKVVSASTDAAAAVEMHEMRMEGKTMVMTPVAEVAIPAKGKTSFNPNGLHIMLFGLKARPAVGETINVTLRLDDGSTVPVAAAVRK